MTKDKTQRINREVERLSKSAFRLVIIILILGLVLGAIGFGVTLEDWLLGQRSNFWLLIIGVIWLVGIFGYFVRLVLTHRTGNGGSQGNTAPQFRSEFLRRNLT